MAASNASLLFLASVLLLSLLVPLPFAAAEGNCRDQVFVINGPDGQPAVEITMLRDYITPGSFVIVKALLPNDGISNMAMLLDGAEVIRSDHTAAPFKQHSFNFVLPLDASSEVFRMFARFATLSFPAGFDAELEYTKCWEMCAACVKEEFYVLRSHRSAAQHDSSASAASSVDHVVSYDPEEDGLLIVSNTQQHMLFGLMPPTGWTIQETMLTIMPDNIQLRLSPADIGAGFFAVPLANEMRDSRHINISFHVKIIPASGDASQARIMAPVFDEETHDLLPYVLCSCL